MSTFDDVKRYDVHIDLYKYYLDLVIKVNAFYLTAAGVFLSIYFTQGDRAPMFISFALILCGIAYAIFYRWLQMIGNYIQEDEDLKNVLRTKIGPDYDFLRAVLIFSAGIAFALAGTLGIWLITVIVKTLT